MVPVSEYGTVSEEATLLEAVNTLRSAQAALDQSRYRHRANLVFAADNMLVAMLSLHDVLEALEPNYKRMKGPAENGSTEPGTSSFSRPRTRSTHCKKASQAITTGRD